MCWFVWPEKVYALKKDLRTCKQERCELVSELDVVRRRLQDAEANELLMQEESTRYVRLFGGLIANYINVYLFINKRATAVFAILTRGGECAYIC